MYLYHKSRSDGTLAAVITIASDVINAIPKLLVSDDMLHI